MAKDNPFSGLLSLQEAADRWGIDSSTIRHAIRQGRLYEGLDCRKYGKQWIVTEDAMYRVFTADASVNVVTEAPDS